MALSQVSATLSVRDVCAIVSPRSTHYVPSRIASQDLARARPVFATGSPLVTRISLKVRRSARTAASSTPIRCEQNTQEGSSLDIWLGRLAMVGFAAAISVEIATGKGLLEVCK
ncbi:hypothetical protein SAY87_019821 [Trapa incisa]|uniref:Uncharacterized protein n=1 Tax=Trapa incisa TaxID=236973 RepID=A0AAN7K0G4_9MYRT|nr:hypothetical protein SAY87_019821 [Trapa incisa]